VINHLDCVNILHSVTAVEPGLRQTFLNNVIAVAGTAVTLREPIAKCQGSLHIHEN
jgi:hypothetical protein